MHGSLLLWDFDGTFCLPVGHRDPRTPSVQGRCVWDGGVFLCPHTGPFSHCTFFPAPGFFFFFLAFEASAQRWRAGGYCCRHKLELRARSPRATPRRVAPKIPRKSPKNPGTLQLSGFFCRNEGEMLSVFFANFFLVTVPLLVCSFSEFCPS